MDRPGSCTLNLKNKDDRLVYIKLYDQGLVDGVHGYDLTTSKGKDAFLSSYKGKDRVLKPQKRSLAKQIIFEGRKEALDIISKGGDIVKYVLNTENRLCPLINSEIKLGKKLGEGAQGSVFSIDLKDGNGDKEYVAKKIQVDGRTIMVLSSYKGKTLLEFFEDRYKFPNQVIKEILKFNGLEPNHIITGKENILFAPSFIIEGCAKKTVFDRTDGNGDITVPEGSIICENAITESIISIILSELYRTGISINFVDVIYFATCKKGSNVSQYTFMEKIDASLVSVVDQYKNEREIAAAYLQIVHAVALYQKYARVVHGDLHTANVFVLNKNSVKWKGEELKDQDYFEYVVGKHSYFIKASDVPYIMKIGDFGLSVLHGPSKVIGDSYVFENGYDQYDGYGPWIPNYYNEAYDLLVVTERFRMAFPHSTFIKKVMAWMLEIPHPDMVANIYAEMINPTSRRPLLHYLNTNFQHVSPKALMEQDFFIKEFAERPKGDGMIIGTY